MATTAVQQIEDLVEGLRASGYYGQDPILAKAPKPVGTCLTATRQLEVVASQIASASLDGGMEDSEFWKFVMNGLFDKVIALADIIDRTQPTLVRPKRSRVLSSEMPEFGDAWTGTKSLIIEHRQVRTRLTRMRRNSTGPRANADAWSVLVACGDDGFAAARRAFCDPGSSKPSVSSGILERCAGVLRPMYQRAGLASLWRSQRRCVVRFGRAYRTISV